MHIKMLRTRDVAPDGITVTKYVEGEIYSLHDERGIDLIKLLISDGSAEEVAEPISDEDLPLESDDERAEPISDEGASADSEKKAVKSRAGSPENKGA